MVSQGHVGMPIPLEKDRVIRVGMIGAGFIAQVTHLHVLAEIAACEVVAIADNRTELRRQVADHFGVREQYASAEQLLAGSACDAYVVAFPRRAMGHAVEVVLATGKAVLAEKPMAYTHAQGQRLVDAAAASGSPFAVGFMKRHDPGVELFRQILGRLIESRELGGIQHVAMRDYCATYATPIPHHFKTTAKRPSRYAEWSDVPEGLPPEWRNDYEYTLNVASHDVNLLRYILAITPVAAQFRVRAGQSQLVTLDCGEFDVALELGLVDTGAWEQTVDIYFRRGRLRLLLPSPLARQEVGRVELQRGGQIDVHTVRPENRVWAFKAQATNFLDVVRGAAQPLAGGRDALVDLEIIEGLWKIARWMK